jgi:hypothetical protein
MLLFPTLLLSLIGCQSYEGKASWMTGASYEWVGFNHRVAHWTAQVGDDHVTMAVIGGTSTTGERPALGDECDPDTCTEFPFLDSSDSKVGWGTVEGAEARFARGQVTLEVGVDGATGEASFSFEPKSGAFAKEGDPYFVLAGLSFDGGVPFETASCYNPSFGWLPVQLGIELGESKKNDDGTYAVAVTARFVAGASEEEVRECLDAVVAQARATVVVDVLGMLTTGESETHEVDYALAYPWNGSSSKPDPQPTPDPAERSVDIGIDGALVGWSRVQFQFNEEDPRGAYLRSIGFEADQGGLATGHATNYSPITQLSGFDYAFEGTVVAVEVGGEVKTGTVTQVIPAELEDDGSARPFEFPLTDSP